jgi:zinc protease
MKSCLFVALMTIAGAFAPCTWADSRTPASITADVKRNTIAGIDVIAKRTAVADVVFIKGSLPAGAIFSPPGKPATARLVAGMLDKGTTRSDKFALARKLEEVGATITFKVDNYVTSFEVTCVKQDLPLVMALLAEQLRTPAFSADEFEKLKPQVIGTLQQLLDDPRARAGGAFAQIAYPQGHPNRTPTLQEQIAAIKTASLEDLTAFHAAHYGPSHMMMVVAGDIDVAKLRALINKSFAGWRGGSALPALSPSTAEPAKSAREETVLVPGKTSVVMWLGQPSRLRYRDADALALRMATTVLGSGFTGRLMKNVRDKEGLTYGVTASMENDTFADGEWRISATFAPQLLDKGIASVQRQLTDWYQNGITVAELEQRKTQLVGSYYVSLATTDGIAEALLEAVQRGYDVSWLDQYPKALQALTLEQVNAAVKKYVDPSKMVLIKSGTVEPLEAS